MSTPAPAPCPMFDIRSLGISSLENEIFLTNHCVSSLLQFVLYTVWLFISIAIFACALYYVLLTTSIRRAKTALPVYLLVILAALGRGVSMICYLTSSRNAFLFLVLPLPICAVMTSSCLILFNWIQVTTFQNSPQNETEADLLRNKIKLTLIFFNITFFCSLVIPWFVSGFFMDDLNLHNTFISAGFGVLGVFTIVFAITSFFFGMRMEKTYPEAKDINRYKWLLTFISFLAGFGCLAVCIWGLLSRSKGGPSNVIYLNYLLFLPAEAIANCLFLIFLAPKKPKRNNVSGYRSVNSN